MVFGNLGATSGTGVAFTRDPNTGEKRLYAEYLPTAQGEDVVAGIRTPYPISYLAEELPAVYTAFITCAAQLEAHYRDVQDLEFTVEQGRLYLLQTRSAKRTAAAAVTIAVALANEGVIRREEAVQRITPTQVTQLLLSRFAPDAKSQAEVQGDLLTTGLNASPGAAYGAIVFDAATAAQRGQTGERVILVRPETSPDDVEGMLHAAGILTARGGATSHAAVVARGLGLPCVAGCADILVDELSQTLTVRGTTTVLRAGDMLSLDGATGEVFRGLIATIAADYSQEQDLHILLGWADTLRTLNVWANADTPRDAARAIQYGAQGIGLCRTEHMFFAPDRLPWVQQMILAATVAERQVALAHLLPIQQEDFVGLFEEMRHPETHMAYPVVIRLMDPPLHEFLPQREEVEQHIATLAQQPDQEAELAEQRRVLAAIERLHEVNPMLGLRGCRLGLLYPEITTMQVRAILQAAAQVQATGQSVSPKIMIPLVGHVNELIEVRRQIAAIASAVETETGQKVAYQCGTMIEVPRAALTAGAIGTAAEFFSFGTNDLTQMTCGISRDDAEGTFLLKYVAGLPQRDVTGQPLYTDAGQERTVQIWSNNPFQTLDQEGVGQLVQMAVVAGRAANPALEIGICGEHGGDPASIAFFATVGVDYVSCSPFRVPVARLAAAQAQLLVTV